MAEDLLIRECPAGVSEDVASYWQQKVPRLEPRLRRFRANRRHIRFSFVCGDGGYEARVVLTLPARTIVVRSDPAAPEHRVAVDQVEERLAEQLRQLEEQDRQENVQRRKRRREQDFAAAQPHLDELHRHRDRDAFFDILTPLLRQLRGHARRELTIAQIEGTIPPGELTVQDVLDEVLIRAWDDWDQRPKNQPLDQWLVRLLHETLDEYGFKPPDASRKPEPRPADAKQPVSIYERIREDDPRFNVENGWEIEQNPDFPYKDENEWVGENNPNWPFLNPLTRDEVLPAEDTPEPWQRLVAEEERRLILDELRRIPRDQRRAFTLHVLEGWSIEDIARAQGRPVSQVRADIEAVRRALRQRLERAEQISAPAQKGSPS